MSPLNCGARCMVFGNSGAWCLKTGDRRTFITKLFALSTFLSAFRDFAFFFSHRRSVKNPRTRASRAPSRGKWPGALRRGSLRQVVNRRPGLAPAEAIDVVVVPVELAVLHGFELREAHAYVV